MPQNTGTYDISTLLATRHQSAAEFGLDTIEQVIRAELAAHNTIMEDMMGMLCDVTTDRQRKYGTRLGGDMQKVDEYGPAPAQRPISGDTVGFPMDRYQFNVGWSATFMQQATPADLAQKAIAAQTADRKRVVLELRRAIFGSTNYTARDHLIDNIDLNVKRFVNADGAGIPEGPNGEPFDGSVHTHYDAIASLTADALKGLIDDVIEHGHGENVIVVIAKADESTVSGLTGFKAYTDPRLILGTEADKPGKRLDITRLDNRAIGIFEGAEVWVKPWGVANYAFAFSAADSNKPLAFRQQRNEVLRGLRLSADHVVHPLQVEFMERDFGVGVWTRTNGAVLYFGGGTYVVPSL